MNELQINSNLIDDFQNAIVQIYNEQDLKCLRGLNNEHEINGKRYYSSYFELTRRNWIKSNGRFERNKILNDILFCSDALLYFTGNLYLYLPLINNPLDDIMQFTTGEIVYPILPNIAAKRFHMFADSVGEKAYNYWDRIGDLIAAFFPDKLEPHKILFSTAIDIIPKDFYTSENYKWLLNFKENQYKNLNNRRRLSVHHTSFDTDFNHKHLQAATNKDEIEKLHQARIALPEFYKNHINLTIEGFEKTLLLLEEFNLKLFSE